MYDVVVHVHLGLVVFAELRSCFTAGWSFPHNKCFEELLQNEIEWDAFDPELYVCIGANNAWNPGVQMPPK